MQAEPVKYAAETRAILGKPLNHDDSVNDRSKGSKLSNASQITSNLWKTTFGEEFSSAGRNFVNLFNVHFAIFLGCMYRGSPPNGQMVQLSFEDQMSLIATTVAKIKLSKIEWHTENFASSNRAVLQLIHSYNTIQYNHLDSPTQALRGENLEGNPRKGF